MTRNNLLLCLVISSTLTKVVSVGDTGTMLGINMAVNIIFYYFIMAFTFFIASFSSFVYFMIWAVVCCTSLNEQYLEFSI